MPRRLTRRRIDRWLRGGVDVAGLVGLSADDIAELTWRAHERLGAEAIDEAERLFSLLGVLTTSARTVSLLGAGACRQARGDFAAAERLYGEAIAIEPDNPFALANRAEVRLLTRRPDEARLDLDAARASADRIGAGDDLKRRIESLRQIALGSQEAELSDRKA